MQPKSNPLGSCFPMQILARSSSQLGPPCWSKQHLHNVPHGQPSGVMPPPNAQIRWQRHRGPQSLVRHVNPGRSSLTAHWVLRLCHITLVVMFHVKSPKSHQCFHQAPLLTSAMGSLPLLPCTGLRRVLAAPTNLGGSGVGSIPHPPSAVGSPQNPWFCFQPTIKGHNLIPKEHKWTV